MTAMDTIINDIFVKEALFFTDVAIKLNQILSDNGYSNVKFPECVYYNFTKGREVLLSRDLRKKGFKMFDKRVGMDLNHAELLVKALAKLHSSSCLLKIRLQEKSVLDLYPFLEDKLLEPGTDILEVFGGLLKNSVATSMKLIRGIKGYEKHLQWLKGLENDVVEIYRDMILKSPKNMRVINHGDCWNNNVVFRYDAEGNPVEITLLDLQICRFGSVGLDLNYFIYSSLTGDVRKKYFDHILDVYFKEFKKVFEAADEKMPFDMDQLKREVDEKMPFGVISAMMGIPLMLSEGEGTFDFNDFKDDTDMEENMKALTDMSLKMMDTNPLFKPRFLAILDDAGEKGFFVLQR